MNVVLSPPPLPSVNRDGVDLHHPHVKQTLHRIFPRRDDQGLPAGGKLSEKPRDNFGARLFQRQRLDDDDLSGRSLGRERRTDRQVAHLLWRLLSVVAGSGAERDPAPHEDWRLAAAVPGATGTFLSPDLACAAGNLAARFRSARARATIGKLRDQNFVHDRGMGLDPKHRRRQLHRPRALPLCVEYLGRRHLGHLTPRTAAAAALRTLTTLPRGPGMAPRTKSRCWPGSTFTTRSPFTVTRSPP